VARKIDPVDWTELTRPKTPSDLARTELGLWLTAPVEAGDQEPEALEITADLRARMAAQRDEVVAAARAASAGERLDRRARRARRAIVVVVLGLLLPLVSAGVGTIGVGPVDAFLGLEEADLGPGLQRMPTPFNMTDSRPRLASSVELAIPWKAGEMGEAIAYVSEGNHLCSFTGSARMGLTGGTGGGSCGPMEHIASELDRLTVASVGTMGGENVSVHGFVTDEVDGVLIDGPLGDTTAYLSEAWVPDLEGARPLKFFVGVFPFRKPGERLYASKRLDRVMNLGSYMIETFVKDRRLARVKNRRLETGK
jgi:hypothetical protein